MIKPKLSDICNINDITNIPTIAVDSVVPINSNIITNTPSKDEEYSLIARITWLCRKYDTSEFFCLTTTYILEDDEDEDFIAMFPLLDSRYFVNYSLISNMLMSSIPHYLTDLKLAIEPDGKSATCIALSDFGKELADKDNVINHLIKIKLLPEQYSSMLFVDNYMISGVLNTNLHAAIVDGTNTVNNLEVKIVDGIALESVRYFKSSKYNKCLIALFTVDCETEDYVESYKLITKIGIGNDIKIPRKIIRSKNIENILDDLYYDAYKLLPLYITYYSFTNYPDYESDEYDWYIKAVNTDQNKIIIFKITPEIRHKLEHAIVSAVS